MRNSVMLRLAAIGGVAAVTVAGLMNGVDHGLATLAIFIIVFLATGRFVNPVE